MKKTSSVITTGYRLRAFFARGEISLGSLTARKAAGLYEARCRCTRPDPHRNELGQSRTFLDWCVSRGWLRRNPLVHVKPQGKRSRGKQQLRIDETRCLVDRALTHARQPDAEMSGPRARWRRDAAVAVLVAVYLGLRAGEIVQMRRRDVDDGGRLLWIPDAKTEAGRRTIQVPAVLRALLRQRAQDTGSRPDGRLFPHDRSWVLQNVKRLCLCRLAGVPEVTAHGLRGLHATLATRVGTTGHASPWPSATRARP